MEQLEHLLDDIASKRLDEVERIVKENQIALKNLQKTIEQENYLAKVFFKEEKPSTITVKGAHRIDLVDLEEVICCAADNVYTEFHLKGGEKIVSSKSIRNYNFLLEGDSFMKISKSHIINRKYVKSYIRSSGELIMKGGIKIEVSRRKKQEFINWLSQ